MTSSKSHMTLPVEDIMHIIGEEGGGVMSFYHRIV